MARQKKYAVIAVILSWFLLLCGCSKTVFHPVDPVFTFDSQVQIDFDGQTYSCQVVREDPVGTKLVLSQPMELSGMTWIWNGDGFSVSYAGLTVEPEECILPSGSFIAILIRTLDAAAKPDALTTSGDGLYYGAMEGENFTVSAEPSTGRVLTLEVPGKNLKAEFSANQ